MRIVIQRVSRASVTIDGTVKSAIKKGYMILIGICEEDTTEDVDWLVIGFVGCGGCAFFYHDCDFSRDYFVKYCWCS